VFQIRSVTESLQPVIVSHTGRALSRQQEDCDGKYWSYPFRKALEIYNQDKLLLDEEAHRQVNRFGLILVEGFFDVAKLVEANCLNVGALMGSDICQQQIKRLVWMGSRVQFDHILLFFDRDPAGQDGALKAQQILDHHGIPARVFDWNQTVSGNGKETQLIAASIKDPADMSVEQLRSLRSQGII
jgi:DNA primase